VKFLIEYVVVRTINFILQLLPLSFVTLIGSGVGFIMYYVIPVRRPVAMTNLRTAFPEKSIKELKNICLNTYRNFGVTFFEFLHLSALPSEKISRMVHFHPRDSIRIALDKGRGCVAVTAHFSSFELLGLAIASNGFPIDFIAKEMRNPRVEKLLDTLRSNTDLRVINIKNGFKKIYDSVSQKRIAAFVADQDAGTNGVKVTFFGMETSFPAGPAVLALRSHAPILFGVNVRIGRSQYHAELHTISHDDLSGSYKKKIRGITQRYANLLESYIRKNPEQYFWMHKRWKSAGIYN
jgi:KDO2-lipid IV(A) lauroyltransferase